MEHYHRVRICMIGACVGYVLSDMNFVLYIYDVAGQDTLGGIVNTRLVEERAERVNGWI